MNPLIEEPLAWLALMLRPEVLLQAVLLVLALVTMDRLRCRTARLAALPIGLPLLPVFGLLGLALGLAGARWGLVLLAADIVAVWLLLRFVETKLLVRWLPPEQLSLLVSRLLRPLFLLGVVLVVLDAFGSIQSLATQPLGVWFGTPIQLGRLVEVLLVLYLVGVGSELPAIWLGFLAQPGDPLCACDAGVHLGPAAARHQPDRRAGGCGRSVGGAGLRHQGGVLQFHLRAMAAVRGISAAR